MKNKWLKIILAASLALNLAFVSTYFYKQPAAKTTHAKRTLKFDDRLNLKKEQKEKLGGIIKKFRITKLQFKQEILEKRMDIIDELGAHDYDLENIKTKTDELNKLENRLNLDFVGTLVRITNILDSKQRLDFLYRLSENWFFIRRK